MQKGPKTETKAMAAEHLLLASAAPALVEEVRSLLSALVRTVPLELLPEDGRVVYSRLALNPPRLAFLPAELRSMDTLTLLRALSPDAAGRVVVMVADTRQGFRTGMDALETGARDFWPMQRKANRLRGDRANELERLARWLKDEDASAPPTASEATPLFDDDTDAPWVLVPETNQLSALGAWLRETPSDHPLIVRVPLGPRMLRVLGEDWRAAAAWPVRELKDGDRLGAGQVHLFADPFLVRLQSDGDRLHARLVPGLTGQSEAARRIELAETLAGSTANHVLWTNEQESAFSLNRLLARRATPSASDLPVATARRRVA